MTTGSRLRVLRRRSGTVFGWIVVTIFLALVGVACSPPASGPAPTELPPRPDIPYAVLWSAAEGTDIQSRPAELVRATIDAGEMASWAGTKNSFPGFAEAVAGTREYFGNWGRPDQPPTPGNRIPVANTVMSRHIASMTVTDTAVTARICTLRQAVKPAYPPAADAEGSFIGEARPRTLEVQLRKPSGVSAGTSGHRDESAANHNSRGNDQPSWNVFGNWSIGAIRDLRGVNDFWGDEPECVAWWRKKFPGWTGTTSLDFQPPHPVNGPREWYNLLAVNPPAPPSYPEWIAPKGADA